MKVNYDDYSLKELKEARNNIDVYKFPERTEELDQRIEQQLGPEGHSSEEQFDRYSTFGARFVASIIDFVVLSTISYFLLQIATKAGDNLLTAVEMTEHIQYVAYSVFFHGLFGQTLGKMATKIKVVDVETEDAINFRQAVIRDSIPIIASVLLGLMIIYIQFNPGGEQDVLLVSYALIAVSFVYMIWHLLEIITMLFNEKRRAIHDFMAGTVVVHTNF